MRILIIRNFPSYMDVKYNTYNIQEVGLAKALTRKGHQADIVFWTDDEEKEEIITFDGNLSITVFYKRGKKFLKNAWYPKIDELISKYDIIQTCEYNQIQSWVLAKKYKDKIVIYHGPYFSKFNKRYNMMCKIFDIFFLRRYIKLETNFIVKSQLAKDFLLRKGISEANISIVGVGIDTQVLTTKEDCSLAMLKEMTEEKECLKILYIGRIEPRRNPEFIIDILKKIIDKGVKAHLYIIGSGESKFVYHVQTYAKNIGMINNITWQEKCEQKYLSNIYKQADVFLLPTNYEIFGMVLLEAMYYGCIVATTTNGGSSILIEDGNNGLIIDERNAQIWSEKIIKAVTDSKLKENMSIKAHNKIENNYLWDSIVEKFIAQYNKILKKKYKIVSKIDFKEEKFQK